MRSTSAVGEYAPLSTNATGPVCGSGPSWAAVVDASAVNGTTYHYRVHSVNPAGRSVASPPSAGATPRSDLAGNAPPPPAGLTVTGSGHHQVALSWAASPGADYYNVWRSTLHADGVGGSYSVGTILLEDAATGTRYTDHSPSDGREYRYHVEAVGAAGTSVPSDGVTARPLPSPPAAAPEALTGKWTNTRDGHAITLNWSPVPGAAGYVLYRTTGADTAFKWPDNFLTVLVETTYVDKGNTEKTAKVKGLDDTLDYSYRVTAVNAAGISPSTAVRVAAPK
jgi:fibronectin type 3 domain-containing protein